MQQHGAVTPPSPLPSLSLSLPSQVSRGDSAGEDALATIDMKLDALESQLRVRECEHVQCTCELVFAATVFTFTILLTYKLCDCAWICKNLVKNTICTVRGSSAATCIKYASMLYGILASPHVSFSLLLSFFGPY